MSLQYAITAGAAPRGGPIRVSACTLLLVLAVAPSAHGHARANTAQGATAQAGGNVAPAMSVEDEVLGNIRAQTIGPATVADLPLPEDFLRRVTDRIVRSSYEERFRIVVGAEHAHAQPAHSDAMDDTEADAKPRIATWQLLMWACIVGFVAVFAGLVWKGRRQVSQ
jgi:hypothetical protein